MKNDFFLTKLAENVIMPHGQKNKAHAYVMKLLLR